MSDNIHTDTASSYDELSTIHLDEKSADTLRRAVNEGIESFNELKAWLNLPADASARQVAEACRQ